MAYMHGRRVLKASLTTLCRIVGRIVCVVVDSTNRKSICDTGRAEKLLESTRFDSIRLESSVL